MSYTNKITLRPLENDAVDRQVLYALIKQSLPALQRWLAWAKTWNGLADVAAFQQKVAANVKNNHQLVYIIEQNGNPCGMIDLHDISAKSAEVGYWVATPSTKRGIGTAAVLEIIALARQHGITTLKILAAAENVASQHVAVNAGFSMVDKLPQTPDQHEFFVYERQVK